MGEGLNTHDMIDHLKDFADFKGEVNRKFGAQDSDIKTLFRRVDKLDAILKSLESLNYSVGTLTEKVDGMNRDLDELKIAPYRKWQKIGFEILKYFVLLLCGYFAAKFGFV